jgi:hypothetical protein
MTLGVVWAWGGQGMAWQGLGAFFVTFVTCVTEKVALKCNFDGL